MASSFSSELNFNQSLVVHLMKISVNDINHFQLSSLCQKVTDWKEFISISKTHGLAGLFYRVIQKNNLSDLFPQEVISEFLNFYLKTLSLNTKIQCIVKELVHLLSKNNIVPCLLKGSYLSEYLFEDPGIRVMLDIDILLKSEDFNTAQKLLEKNGFVMITTFKNKFIQQQQFHYNLAFIKNNILIELHNDLTAKHDLIRFDLSGIWQRVELHNFSNYKILSLSATDNLLHICSHLLHHINNLEVRLAMYIDIAILLKTFKNRIDYKLLYEEARKMNTSKELECLLNWVQHYFFSEDVEYALNTEKEFYSILTNDYADLSKKSNYSFRKKLSLVNGKIKKVQFIFSEMFPSLLYIQKRYLLQNRYQAILYYPVYLSKMLYKLFSLK